MLIYRVFIDITCSLVNCNYVIVLKLIKSTVYLVFRYRSCSLKYIYCNSSLFYIYRAKQEEKKKKEEEKRLKEEEKQKEEEEKVIL